MRPSTNTSFHLTGKTPLVVAGYLQIGKVNLVQLMRGSSKFFQIGPTRMTCRLCTLRLTQVLQGSQVINAFGPNITIQPET